MLLLYRNRNLKQSWKSTQVIWNITQFYINNHNIAVKLFVFCYFNCGCECCLFIYQQRYKITSRYIMSIYIYSALPILSKFTQPFLFSWLCLCQKARRNSQTFVEIDIVRNGEVKEIEMKDFSAPTEQKENLLEEKREEKVEKKNQ